MKKEEKIFKLECNQTIKRINSRINMNKKLEIGNYIAIIQSNFDIIREEEKKLISKMNSLINNSNKISELPNDLNKILIDFKIETFELAYS